MDNQRASKNTFKATTFKVEENLRTFQGLHRNFWTFQGKMEFRESSRTFQDCVNPDSVNESRHFENLIFCYPNLCGQGP